MSETTRKLANLMAGDKAEHSSTSNGTVRQVDGNRAFVLLDGGTTLWCDAVDVKAITNDRVRVETRSHKSTLVANYTHPVTDDAVANAADDKATEALGKVNTLEVDALKADSAVIKDLQADTAKVHDLTAEQLSAATGYIEDLTAGNLTAEELVADHATVGGIDATYAHIDLANVNNAWIENGVIKDAAIGDAQILGVSANKLTAGEINADVITVRNLHTSNLTVDTADGYVTIGNKKTPTKEFLDSLKDELQQEIDGAIETFTSTAVPLKTNYPASDWVISGATAEEQRKAYAKHVGDICYVQNSALSQNGYAYRWAYDSAEQDFKWVLIKDSDVTAALSRLQTAEGKITGLETFESNTSSWIDETDEGLRTIRTNHTTLSGRVDKTVVETKQLWYTKANTTAPSKPSAEVTSTSTEGNAWRIVVPAYNASYPNYYYCLQYKLADGTFAWSDVVRDIAMGESQQQGRKGVADAATADGKAVTAQNTANANIKSSVQLWYTKANTTAPSKPTAQVTVNDASKTGQWNLAIPTYSESYPHYFYCYQQQKGNGTYQWSDVVYDRSISEAQAKAQTALPSSEFNTFKTTTFKEVVDEVGEQSSTITTLSETVSNKADSSTVSTLSNTVNQVKQTADTNKTSITNLTQTVNQKADSSTVTTLTRRTSTIEQNLSGITTRVGKTESTLETVSNPNLTPWFSQWDNDYWHTIGDTDGASSESRSWTQDATEGHKEIHYLADGWAHVVMDSRASAGNQNKTCYINTWVRAGHLNVAEGEQYTWLAEVRNLELIKADSSSILGIRPSIGNATLDKLSNVGSKMQTDIDAEMHCTVTAKDDFSSLTRDTCGYMYIPTGCYAEFDVRVSIYEGEYSGPYKPYVDQTLSNRVKSAETSIEQNAEDITLRATKAEFDALSIGGRNLLPYSKPSADNMPKVSTVNATNTFVTEDGFDCYKGTGAATSFGFYASNGKLIVPLEANTQYIYSAWIKLTTTTSATSVPLSFVSLGHFTVRNENSTKTDKTHEDVASERIYSPSTVTIGQWTKITITFTTNELAGSTFGVYSKYNYGTEYTLFIRDMKLEKGNRATDWTPAPEDMATAAELAITAEGITSTVSKIGGVKQLVCKYANTLANIKAYATYDTSTAFTVKSTEDVRVGDTVYLKDTDSTRNCTVYIKGVVTAVSSATSVTVKGRGYEDALPSDSVISSINQSAESVKIQARRVEIDGTAVFKAANSIPDTRGTNENPQYYFTNYPQQSVTEFKQSSVMGLSGDYYCYVTTVTGWKDSSGGYPKQTAQIGSKTYWRVGTSNTAWGAWQETENTSGAQSKATAAVYNLQVGGRNLLLGTKDWSTAATGGASQSYESDGYYNGCEVRKIINTSTVLCDTVFTNKFATTNFEPDAYYTFSFWAKASAAINIWSFWFNKPNVVDHAVNQDGVESTRSDGGVQYPLSTEWRRYWITWHISASATDYPKSVIVARIQQSATVWLAGCKFEKGNKATDWSPAPEDVAADSVKRTQRIYYRKTVTGAPAAPSSWVVSSGDSSNAWTQKHISISSADKYIYTCEQYEMADGTLGNTSILLDDTITVIDGGKILTGTVEANALKANSLTLGYINQNDAATAAALLNSNVVVGGKNLLLDTGSFSKQGTSSGYFIEYTVNIGTISSYVLEEGVEYTFSVDVTSSLEPFVISVGAGSGAFSKDVKTSRDLTSGRCSVTFTPTAAQLASGSVFAFRAPRYSSQGTSFTYSVSHPKLEKGNRATDWTPAPEDVTSDINAVSAAVSDVNGSLSDSISGLSESLEQTNGRLTSLTQAVNDADKERAKWIQADDNGLTIGASGSSYKLQLDNNSVDFMVGDQLAATASVDAFIPTALRLGDYVLSGSGGYLYIDYDPLT